MIKLKKPKEVFAVLKGKTIVLGVTGGIAAYKAASLASLLVKQHADVQVLMTENATKFITPITFEQLTGNKALVDTFDRNFQSSVEHIAVADRADFVLIAPATANVIAKLAHGLADDMLTTTVLACDCPKAIAPAMNTKMYENPVTQDNLAALRRYGWEVVEPASGRLACGAVGKGKLPEPEALLETCLHGAAHEKDAGPGALSHKSFLGAHGLCHRESCRPPRRRGHARLRAGESPAPGLYGDRGHHDCAGYV